VVWAIYDVAVQLGELYPFCWRNVVNSQIVNANLYVNVNVSLII